MKRHILLTLIAAVLLSACAPSEIHATVHLICLQDVRPLEQKMTCKRQSSKDWPYMCEARVAVANMGSQVAKNVQVRVEYGQGLPGLRSFTLNPLGDLTAGQQITFKSQFGYTRRPASYDLYVECAADETTAKAPSATQTALSPLATLSPTDGAPPKAPHPYTRTPVVGDPPDK